MKKLTIKKIKKRQIEAIVENEKSCKKCNDTSRSRF